MAKNRYVVDYPVIGIRPIVDGRRGPMQLRESLEDQVMAMANAAKKLFEENLFYSNGEPVKVVLADTTIGRVPEAAACAACFGVSPSVIATALGSLWGIAGRIERVKLGTVTDFSVFIDYAHTPDALSNLLMSAQRIKRRGQRIVLVFGCGGDRDKRKRPVMGKIAEELADFCVVTSDNSRSEDPKTIINDILAGMSGENHIVIPERARAIEYAIREACEGDIILLAGKGHEEYEIVRDGKHPFSEKKLAKQAALRYRSGGSTEEQVDQGKDDEK